MPGSWTQTWSLQTYKNQEQKHPKLDFLNVQFAAAHCDFSPYFDDLCIAKLAKRAPHINYWLTQCSCGETQTMSHIVESCPQTRLHGGLSKLHSADDDAAAWLTSYGS